MEQFKDHLEKAVNLYQISPKKIKDFLNYINLTEEEIKLIKSVGSKIDNIPDEVIINFYNHLLDFPEIKKLFENKKELIQELKEKHKTYIKQVLSGNYNFDYVVSRFTIGYVHAKEGILSSYHIGAYGKYTEEITNFLKKYVPENKIEKFLTAIFKVFLFDLSFSLESYFLKKQEIIEEINKRYRVLLDASNDGILLINAQNLRIVDFNKKLKEMVGLEDNELFNLNAVKIAPKILWKKYLKEVEKVKTEKTYFFPHMLIENKKTKELIPCEINASPFEFDGYPYIIAIFRDIRKRKSLESEIERINRLYSVLSKVNLAITRHHTIDEIFQETVKTIVNYGKFKTACISEVDLKNKKIIPKYIYGDTKYFEDIHFPLGEKLFIESISYLEDDVIVIKDINQLPEECKWKKRIKKMGFNSAIVIPIYKTSDKRKKDIRWILSIYSNEIKHFEEREISLVKEISFDLSFAVERIREKLKFKYFYIYDEITNLPNRNSFIKKINSLVESKEEKFSVIVIDIDKFKAINDTFGYLSGDLLLKKTSQKLKNLITGKDELARIGSDEFGIILFDVEEKEDLLNFIKSFEKEFSSPLKINNEEIFVTSSIGIANFPEDGKTAEEIMTNAETALSKAKEIEDNFYFYSQDLNRETHEIFELEKDLRLGIRNKEFEIFYQPKINIENNKIIGAEALLRWKRKGKELVPPYKFIPVLEETGLINQVGLIVLEKVCDQILKWREENIFVNVAVNISAVQLKTQKFLKQFFKLIENRNCVSNYLEFEITETALMENIEYVYKVFKELENYNVKFSIDDFGTGYSSLVYLKKLPVYALKIDREFIKDIPQDKDDLTIAKTIIDLAENLNKETIAEGVETEDQLDILKKMGCRIAQGFYFSKPIPADEFKEFYLNFENNKFEEDREENRSLGRETFS